jgi:hypothetical protein
VRAAHGSLSAVADAFKLGGLIVVDPREALQYAARWAKE